MASRTHYEVLGVQPSADGEVIEKAYRRRVRHVHPDVNDEPDALERFYTLQRAYEVLRDPDRRRRYDHQLAAKATPKLGPRSSSEIRQRRAAARVAAGAAPDGVASAAAAAATMAYGGRPLWDPMNNPVLRKKMERVRRKKWFARFELGVMLFNFTLAAFGAYQGYVLLRFMQAARAAQPTDPAARADPLDPDASDPSERLWLDQLIEVIDGAGIRAEPRIGPWPDDAKVERLGPDDDWRHDDDGDAALPLEPPQPADPAADPDIPIPVPPGAQPPPNDA